MANKDKGNRYTINDKKKLLNCLEATDFNVSQAIKIFNHDYNKNLSRRTVYQWLENDEFFKTEKKYRLEKLLDEAEHAHRLLRNGIPIKDEETGEIIAWQEKPDRQAIEFFLKTKGRERGYIEKSDLQVSFNEPPKIEIIKTDKEK